MPSLLLSNPWVILGLVLAMIVSHGTAYWRGGVNAENAVKAEAADDERIRAETREAAMQGAAAAIAKIEVKQVTIRQRVEKEIHEKPVYRDCRHTADGLRLVNEALTGAISAGGGELPGADRNGK